MNRKVLTVALTLALFGLVLASPAWANEERPVADNAVIDQSPSGGAGIIVSTPSQMTLTVLQPVEIPGHVLQPGQYSFRLSESDNAVAVSKLDGSAFYGNFFLVPTRRDEVGGAAVYTAEGQGSLNRIASWYFPGELDGYAFIYPAGKHVQMAKARLQSH